MTASPPRRLGLVVATTEYDDARLSRLGAPLADALELARTLIEQGEFEVETLINAEAQTVQRRLERFCKTGRQSGDTILVYLTGHGVKDVDGNLYFALRDTDRDLLRTTALSADLLASVMDESPSRSQVLVLDCCYSGAIARALRPKGQEEAGLAQRFASSANARGRVVLAASGGIEPAWEGDSGSIYTRAIVDGIRTGAADLDGNGQITAGELHSHVTSVLRNEGRQTPRKFEFDDAGDLTIARSGKAQPLPLPAPPRPEPKRAASPLREPRPARARRRLPAWIPAMLAVALATLVVTLWLTGSIGILPSPLLAPTTTTLEAVPPPPATTAVAQEVGTSGQATLTTGATSATTPPAWNLVLDEHFSRNDREWAEGDFPGDGGSSSYTFVSGIYEGSYSTVNVDQVFFSTVPYVPGPGLTFVETETTAYLDGTLCGIALQTTNGALLVVAIGGGEVTARLYLDNAMANSGSWPVALETTNETELGLWIDSQTVTIYVNDNELATFDEPGLVGISNLGVALMGPPEGYCGFDYLLAHES